MATNQFSRSHITSISNSSGSTTTMFATVANAGSTARTYIIIGMLVCNKTSSSATVSIYNDTAISGHTDVFYIKDLSVPANSSVELSFGKIVLHHDGSNGDTIKAYGSASATFDVTLSILGDVN